MRRRTYLKSEGVPGLEAVITDPRTCTFYYTTDGFGKDIRKINFDSSYNHAGHITIYKNTIYIGAYDSIYRSTDKKNFVKILNVGALFPELRCVLGLDGFHIQPVSISPDGLYIGKLFMIRTSSGMYMTLVYTTNGGSKWNYKHLFNINLESDGYYKNFLFLPAINAFLPNYPNVLFFAQERYDRNYVFILNNLNQTLTKINLNDYNSMGGVYPTDSLEFSGKMFFYKNMGIYGLTFLIDTRSLYSSNITNRFVPSFVGRIDMESLKVYPKENLVFGSIGAVSGGSSDYPCPLKVFYTRDNFASIVEIANLTEYFKLHNKNYEVDTLGMYKDGDFLFVYLGFPEHSTEIIVKLNWKTRSVLEVKERKNCKHRPSNFYGRAIWFNDY